jgi:hypothetical protein
MLAAWLPEQLKDNPDLTLQEHCEAFEEERGLKVSTATMSRAIRRLPGRWLLKKVLYSSRTRRGGEGGLAGEGRRDRSRAVRVGGRVCHAHLYDSHESAGS